MELPKTKTLFESVKPPVNFAINYQRLHKAEEFLLASIDITDRAQRFNIQIDFRGTSQFIRTLLVEPEEPLDAVHDIILIHGFGGSWTSLYLLLPYLTKEFRIWCIDLLGMAGSSRPEFEAKTPEEGLAFFIDSIEAWRQKVGLIKFYLAGHSLGGYIGGHYAMKFPEYIIKLILISPGGVTQRDPISNTSGIRPGWKYRLVNRLRSWIWENRWTPGELFKRHSRLGNFSLRMYIKHRFKAQGAIQNTFVDYFTEVLNLPTSSEKCLFYMFGIPGYYGLVPLGRTFITNPPSFPIDFYYGDKDRMSPAGAKIVCEHSDIKAKLFIIANSGHQISMDNPKQLAQLILFNRL